MFSGTNKLLGCSILFYVVLGFGGCVLGLSGLAVDSKHLTTANISMFVSGGIISGIGIMGGFVIKFRAMQLNAADYGLFSKIWQERENPNL